MLLALPQDETEVAFRRLARRHRTTMDKLVGEIIVEAMKVKGAA